MSKITIDNKNKEKYSNGTYPEINEIKWEAGHLDENILKNFPNLTILDCNFNKITDLCSLQHCRGLTKLLCSANKITDITPLQSCTGLTELYCGYNKITDLCPLQHCRGLTKLNCCANKITDLSPLQDCTGLTLLLCSDNQIIDLSPLQYCTELITLNCNGNKMTVLSPLQYCRELIELHCMFTKITDLSPLQYCRELNELDCSYNLITSLEPLVYLRNLFFLTCDNNPLNPPSIQVARFLERIDRINRNNNSNSIYTDEENVHDVKVQQSVMDSVRNLMRDKLTNNKEITLDIDSVLTSELKTNTKSRLLEYFEETDYHVILLITYKELFTYVWNRIINNPNKTELLKILDDNIQDSECKCFTGRFNRTLSTLVGFYDDIQINISDNSRIGAIILEIKKSIIPYDPDKHKELARIALLKAGYDSETIELWISAIE